MILSSANNSTKSTEQMKNENTGLCQGGGECSGVLAGLGMFFGQFLFIWLVVLGMGQGTWNSNTLCIIQTEDFFPF